MDLVRCKEAGMNGFVLKPFKTIELIRSIATATGRDITEQPGHAEEPLPTGVNPYQEMDIQVLKKFCDYDNRILFNYLDNYVNTIGRFTEALQEQLAAHDTEGIRQNLHKLKPRIQAIGMKEAYKQVQHTELLISRSQALKKDEIERLKLIIEAVNNNKQALEELKSGLSAYGQITAS
jgi:CheY-like chemotaxis protein